MMRTLVLVLALTSVLMGCTPQASDQQVSASAPWMQDKAAGWELLGVDSVAKLRTLKPEEAAKLQESVDIDKVNGLLMSSVDKLAQEKPSNSKAMKDEIYNLMDLYGVVCAFQFSKLGQTDKERLVWYQDQVVESEKILKAAQRHLGEKEPTLVSLKDAIENMKAATKKIEARIEEEEPKGQ